MEGRLDQCIAYEWGEYNHFHIHKLQLNQSMMCEIPQHITPKWEGCSNFPINAQEICSALIGFSLTNTNNIVILPLEESADDIAMQAPGIRNFAEEVDFEEDDDDVENLIDDEKNQCNNSLHIFIPSK